jgi:hypothetical protein
MTTETLNEFISDGTEIEIINCYTFLGTTITRDGHDHKEINRRLSIGRMAMTKLEKITKDRDVTEATKIKIAETIIFPTVTYGNVSWTVQKKERKKIGVFEPKDVEKNFMSRVDREKNEPISFGRTETQKITRSNNTLIKATLFWSHYESKRVTEAGHYAWTSCSIQEAGKTTDALA